MIEYTKYAKAIQILAQESPTTTDLFSGGFVGLALTVGWYFLKRSDTRESDLRKEAEEQLAREREAHEQERQAHRETTNRLIALLHERGLEE